jgi:FtsP/CotA-like multicopper oxidase with cupredoxin domain
MLPHERYSVAFRADNPGLWMLHCHNLDHAANGLSMHVMYAGVSTPFRAGKSAHNDPE